MKYYKLLKDLPTFKAGDLFYINPDQGCLVQKDTLILAYAKKTLENFPNILTDWFEEIEEPECKRWRAKKSETYWLVNGYGEVDYDDEYGLSANDNLYAIGNYFKTAKEADDYRKYLIARQVLLDDAEGEGLIRGKFIYFAGYDFSLSGKGWCTEWSMNTYNPGQIYFKTEEALKKSLKEHKEQWEIVRKYEMGDK